MKVKISQLWQKLNDRRKHLLNKYVQYSEITDPEVFPESLLNNNIRLTFDQLDKERDISSIGAEGVNNLAAVLNLALFPAHGRFFRDVYDQRTLLAEPDAKRRAAIKSQLDSLLIMTNEAISQQIMKSSIVQKRAEVLVRLIVTGNHLMILQDDDLEWQGIENYVLTRDSQGRMTKLIVRTLVDEYEAVMLSDKFNMGAKLPVSSCSSIDQEPIWAYYRYIYMGIDGKYHVRAYIEDTQLDSVEETYTPDNLPYYPLMWKSVVGSHYGVPYISELYADLVRLSHGMQNRSQAGYAMSRLLGIIDPESTATATEWAQAKNGGLIFGKPTDYTIVDTPKIDLQHISIEIVELKQSLQQAFLVFTPRDGERVTAFEISKVDEQLQKRFATVYNLLAESLQKPLIAWGRKQAGKAIRNIDVEGILNELNITPVLLGGYGGLMAVERREAIRQYLQTVLSLPESQQVIDTWKFNLLAASVENIPPIDFILSIDEMQQQADAAAQMAVMQQMNGGLNG